jgi:hypothetical protein
MLLLVVYIIGIIGGYILVVLFILYVKIFWILLPGLPDPPLDVHLVPTSSRSGPNTLEMSWIPVTITEQGTSNGARVTGYKVYLNDFACAEVRTIRENKKEFNMFNT